MGPLDNVVGSKGSDQEWLKISQCYNSPLSSVTSRSTYFDAAKCST